MPIAIPRFENEGTSLPEVLVPDVDSLVIRPARVSDVHGMSTLINSYASSNVMLARGPQYLYQHIQDYMVATAREKSGGGEVVVACGSLHVLWEDLAEIRSIAVHSACHHHGLGSRLVSALVERCCQLGIPRVFVFTLAPSFFASCGFEDFRREDLPPVVWVECSKCPKFYRCDEIVLMKKVSQSGGEAR